MKHAIISGSLVLPLVMAMGAAGHAGNYDEFIHLVKHRDVHGNLVVPESHKTRQERSSHDVQQAPIAKSTSYSDGSLESHVESNGSSYTQTSEVSNQDMATDVVTEMDEGKEQGPMLNAASDDNLQMDDSDIGEYVAASKMMHSGDEAMHSESDPLLQRTMLPSPTHRYAFLGANWGMSIPEVKTKETAELSWELDARVLVPGEHRLGYQTQVEGIGTFLTYGFEHDRLSTTKYYFDTKEEENEAQPILNYKKVKNWITQTYGPPQTEEKIWVNELYQYAPELWGRALMRGHLTIVDHWDVEGTSIMLLLNGGEDAVSLIAEFSHTNDEASPDFVQLFPSFLTL